MNEQLFFGMMILSYLFSSLCYIAYAFLRHKERAAAVIFMWASGFGGIGWASHVLFLFARGSMADHVPWANQFEAMGFLAFCVVTVYFLLQWFYKLKIFGSLVMPVATLILIGSALLPQEYKGAGPVMPALNSYWIKIHVTIMLISYAIFAFSFCVSIAYLLRERHERLGLSGGAMANFPTAEALDELTYRTIAIGFPLITVGIMCGAAWGHVAWGRYWGWDPKETWAFITWCIYVIFLHGKMILGWEGKRIAWMSIGGFLCVLFTFFGVNFLLSGLHSYAKP